MGWPKHPVACIGDSQTDPLTGNGVRMAQTWPRLLELALQARGADVFTRNFGKAGDKTADVLARLDAIGTYDDAPALVVEYVGVNDVSGAVAQAVQQANHQAILKAVKHGAYGSSRGLGGPVTVADQTALPSAGLPGQRYVVLADGSATGGAAAANQGDASTIGGAGGGAQTVWENRNPLAGEAGWGRVATAATPPTVCKRVIVVSTNYLNWTSGGDTPAAPSAGNATARAAAQAAVAAENVQADGVDSVVYADLYGLQRARIVAGTDPDFSSVAYDQTRSWHYAQNNQHHNHYGHWLTARAVLAAIPSAWIDALK